MKQKCDPRLAAMVTTGLLLTSAAAGDCNTPNKSIAIVGSSTARGVGASDYSHSWAGLFTNAMVARDFTVENYSVNGFSSRDALLRFQADVRPKKPGIVLLGTSVFNETGVGTTADMIAQYLRNTRELIRDVEATGATPIIIAPYPSSRCGPDDRVKIEAIYREFDAEGVQVLDFFGPVADSGCGWQNGLSVDGLHPTNAGHRYLFDSIPLGFFDEWPCAAKSAANPTVQGAWLIPDGTSTPTWIRLQPASSMMSWTVSVWIKPGDGRTERVLAAVSGDWIQIRRLGPIWQLRSRAAVLATQDIGAQHGFVHVVMTYSQATSVLRVLLDGKTWTAVSLVAQPATEVMFGGGEPDAILNAVTDMFSQILVYRTPLPFDVLTALGSTSLPWRSVEAYLPLANSPGVPLINAAPSLIKVEVHGVWERTPTGASRGGGTDIRRGRR